MATNGHVLIRVAKSETTGEYSHSEKPKISSVFVKTKKEIVVTIEYLEKLLSEVEQVEDIKSIGDDIECNVCKGSGEDTWEYSR